MFMCWPARDWIVYKYIVYTIVPTHIIVENYSPLCIVYIGDRENPTPHYLLCGLDEFIKTGAHPERSDIGETQTEL